MLWRRRYKLVVMTNGKASSKKCKQYFEYICVAGNANTQKPGFIDIKLLNIF